MKQFSSLGSLTFQIIRLKSDSWKVYAYRELDSKGKVPRQVSTPMSLAYFEKKCADVTYHHEESVMPGQTIKRENSILTPR